MKSINVKRSANFVPDLVRALLAIGSFTCKFSSLPKSYQSQPYNLRAKIIQRGGIDVNINFNKLHDTFVITRIKTL